jgi:hypothetical protein
MLHSLFYLETALCVLGGNSTHHQEHIQLYLQHLVFVTPLLLELFQLFHELVPPPIIMSAYNCIYSIWYLSHCYCYLPLSWKSWNCSNSSTSWYLHPSSGAHTTVSTASGICHTITATCCYRGRVGTLPALPHGQVAVMV